MKTALFTNFTNEEFIGYWNGKAKRFAPGASVSMPDYLAKHYAKHLTNRELLKKGLDRCTSPKRPDDVPQFMELFNKACILEADEVDETVGGDSVDVQMSVVAKKHHAATGPGSEPQIIPPAPGDEDDEENFGAKPVDTALDAQNGA